MIFLVAFAVVWLVSLFGDYIKWKDRKVKNVSKPLYVCLNAATLLLYIAYAANVRIPMPTTFFIRYVAPWINTLVRGTFHA
ncbi:hypothetical protein E5161_00995 [Cohnella pontilimi]|uniref:Uncharacterized protein n=1 Tax=Cohnella pontilimi TaxID=2564100 RepID=A0A4U0FGF1_9BACL|nr:hypothetical protein [Cohnella pontilimi]TJY44005.1 hypothetical protein E5161_00995 [Cohnella pontilimi]